jgi:hypothetical protein
MRLSTLVGTNFCWALITSRATPSAPWTGFGMAGAFPPPSE